MAVYIDDHVYLLSGDLQVLEMKISHARLWKSRIWEFTEPTREELLKVFSPGTVNCILHWRATGQSSRIQERIHRISSL